MNEDYLANIRPAHRQLVWQRMETYAFIHFGMNTMTDREWGLGHEDPALFDPDQLDVDQWMDAIVSAGMTGVILTCKHHDGFCLWPSAYTRHSVSASPWKDGKGDLVREVSDSARRHGIKFGVYLSPWDRTEATYGSGKPYDDYYVNQLIELLTHYGPIFCVWMDGACGEGANGHQQIYDWERYYAVIRALQPEAVMSVCGPDVRWCGNEAGHTRENEWSVVPAALKSAEMTASKSQHEDDGTFSRKVTSDEEDLGSFEALQDYSGPLAWYPAEVNTSIRPGWFHHLAEDSSVRSADELFDIWCTSVGGNATFLLNVPPNRHGRISCPDVAALREFGKQVADFKNRGITQGVSVTCSTAKNMNRVESLLSTEKDSGYWMPGMGDTLPSVVLRFDSPQTVEAVILREHITEGQRIDKAEVLADGKRIAIVGCVGYQRIVRFDAQPMHRLEIRILQSRGMPMLDSVIAVSEKRHE